jgi:hypothetical protein
LIASFLVFAPNIGVTDRFCTPKVVLIGFISPIIVEFIDAFRAVSMVPFRLACEGERFDNLLGFFTESMSKVMSSVYRLIGIGWHLLTLSFNLIYRAPFWTVYSKLFMSTFDLIWPMRTVGL